MAKTTRKELRKMKEQRYEVNPCPRCRVATLRWITSSWRCASCGYHEGCCG